ncbi:hypothetical protein [Microbacterium hydrocarbonoxydans]|uniref:hypothetical protein n=1 Tax=Microbacterium hydrocarbonoxydans TaxID=273678 RepID=UPI00203C532C|nr:hypothetical protein [Microbacterium hydrocarbonoxydans]MCM3778797.1 hypothetical protein [Microbacterium hydrocarbonoxydans]
MDESAVSPQPEPRDPWRDIVGPCRRSESIGRVLGLSDAEVRRATESLELLAVVTDEGTTLYPDFQIHEGRVVDGLQQVLAILHTGIDDPWTWTQFLNVAVYDETEGRDVRWIEEMRAGRLEAVLNDARHTAWAWSS